MADWHCKQIPNGSNPLVVCEREALQAEIERLRAVLDAERALADQLAVALLGTASGRIIPTDDEWAGVVKMRSAALDAWEARRG